MNFHQVHSYHTGVVFVFHLWAGHRDRMPNAKALKVSDKTFIDLVGFGWDSQYVAQCYGEGQ